jgi:regulator of replication initiation timing
MKTLLIALMFIGVLFAQDNKEVKAFVMHNSQTGNFDENAIMIPANEKMNKLGKTPKSLPYATSLKKLYEEGWEINNIFYDSTDKGGSAVFGAVGASKSRTVFIMVR